MDTQPGVLWRSSMCPSVTRGTQCLRVKVVVTQLDLFRFPLQDAFYLLHFQEDRSDCLPATITNAVLGGWHF